MPKPSAVSSGQPAPSSATVRTSSPALSFSLSLAKLTAMVQEAGFVLAQDDPRLLPYQTFLVFQKPAAGARAPSK